MKVKTISAVFVAAVLLGLAAAPQAQAADPWRKLGRGFANVLFGIFEIPRTIAAEHKERGVGTAVVIGPFKGIVRAVGRELTGAYEIVFFPIPIPPDYEPVMTPEFPWEVE